MSKRESAKYYEPLYFYDGHTLLTEENQSFIIELLNKNQAVGIFGIFDEDDFPIYCISGFAMTNLGYTFEELMDISDSKFINLLYEKDRQPFIDSYNEGETNEIEFRLVTKGNQLIWIHCVRRKSVSLDGRNVCFASVRVVDDTVKRDSELLAALAKEYSEIIYVDENKKRYRRIKNATNDEPSIGTLEELLELLSKHQEIVHPSDHAYAEVYKRMHHLSPAEMDRGGDYQATYRAKLNGKYVWLQFRAIFGGNMNLDTGHIILTFRRVDREVQRELDANRILSESLARAEQASRIKNQFLSRMSHDLRTPLNGITGMIEIIKKNTHNLDKVIDCSHKIQVSCQHLLSLVNDVLDMNNLERGSVEFENVPFDFLALAEEETESVRKRAEDAGITFQTNFEAFRHCNVMGSPKHIRQIFSHILDNAIQYNKPNGTISIYGREVSDSDRLTVFEFLFEDTGIGMSENFVKRIFDPFEQEHNDARTTYAGTGLGMSIVKKMIDQMNGDILVKSKEGIGTKISITLPLRVCTQEQEQEETVKLQETEISLVGMKVLLVEDNALNMEIAQFLLEDIGLEVYKAENGQIAVDMFQQSEVGFYNMIFMDLMMPVMDGYEATRQIRAMGHKDSKYVPIVAVSANVLDEDIKKSKMAGMNEHLPKPLDESQLLKVVIKYLCKIA